MTEPPVVYVLRHTHWDREWYHPASVFRKRLVDLVDDLLSDASHAPFVLDGQAIVLRDYLTVRPERAAEMSAALQSGRLEAGPWYVLPDELIPSGEALVRNLLAGRRALRALRAIPPSVLWCPDSFGHPAALPSIAAGFGYSSIVLWRGYGSRRFPRGDAARWTAPDGHSALLFHLSPDGYEFGSRLPTSAVEADQRWGELRRVLQPRSTLGILLVPNGADHHAPQPDAETAIAALSRAAEPLTVQVGGLARLGALLEDRAATHTIPQVAGELRDSYGYTWTLGGTLASRAYQKRANAQAERLLLRDVEPWTALARLQGARSARHHMNSAWETLLACHPHDSLCGCSIDAVAEAVDARFTETTALAAELRDVALAALIGHDADAAREHASEWRSAVLIRNPAPRSRAGVARIDLDVALAEIPVGPGSANRSRTMEPVASVDLPLQVLSSEPVYARAEASRFYPVNFAVERRRCVVWTSAVPPYGMKALPLTQAKSRARVPDDVAVSGDARTISSRLGNLTRNRSGLTWRHGRSRGKGIALIGFEIARDRGDLYTPSPGHGTRGHGLLRGSRVVLRGPLRAAIDSRWRVSMRGRAAQSASVDVTARASLDAGADVVRITVHGVNSARDHRLRILLNTGIRARRVLADAAFAFIERKALRVPAADRRAETPPATAPLQRFVTLFDGARGCTVISDGLAEYEVLADGRVAVTLVRAVGQLSRADIPERPGHAGWPAATPAAQCLGPFAAEFALFWHGGDTAATRARIVDVVDDVLLPLTGATHLDLRAVPEPTVGIALEGAGLAFSSFKESDDGQYVVARCVNVTQRDVHGAWVLPASRLEACTARLDESPTHPLQTAAGRIPIVVAARGISTVLIALTREVR